MSRIPSHIEGPTTDAHLAATSSPQDFGIEKHGKLPPPFYPSDHQSILPQDVGLTPDALANDPVPNGAVPNELKDPAVSDVSGDEESTDLTIEPTYNYQTGAPFSAPAFPANPTPPADNLEAVQYQYLPQAHHPFVPLQHQPTPPSDATPSPTNYSYQRYPYPHNVSFHHPQNIGETDPSPTQSAYQGYTYAPNNVEYPPSSQVYSPSNDSILQESPPHDATEVFHDSQIPDLETFVPALQAGVDDHYVVPVVPVTSLIEAKSDLPNQKKLSGSNLVQEPASIFDNGLLGGRYSHLDFVSNSIQQPEYEESSTDEMNGNETPLPTNSSHQVWQQTVLGDLQHVSLDPPFSTLHLSSFLSQNFDSPQYADCHLRVIYSDNRLEPEEFFLHRVVIAQSPALADLLASSELDNNGLRLIQIEVLSTFVTPATLRLALRSCYGQSAWDFIGLETSRESAGSPTGVPDTWMRDALAFAAAGTLLHMEDVVARGTQIASAILNWDNIETALSFVMEGVVDGVPEMNSEAEEVQLQSEGINGSMTQSGAKGPTLPETNRPMTSLNPYTHGVAAYRLKQLCLRFLSDKISREWSLNTSAGPLKNFDRLPVKVKGQATSTSSRLSHIQFGSLPTQPPEDEHSLDFRLSSVILSIPHFLLQELLEQVDHVLTAKTVRSIVSERERRRRQALQDGSVLCSQRTALLKTWGAVGWQEVANIADVDGTQQITITRKWTDFREPSDEQ